MEIVGELINSSRKPISDAIEAQDAATIQKIARDQWDSNINFIDVNSGTFPNEEADYLKWLVTVVQEVADGPCSLDSPNPRAIESALQVHKGTPMINSITLEKDRFDYLLPIVAGTDFKVVALCISDEGMPEGTDKILANADKLVNSLVSNNVPIEHIYIDPLVKPISVNDLHGIEALDAIQRICTEYPGAHTIWGNSNISFGIPRRWVLNQVLIASAITRGLDSAIINPLDKRLRAFIVAAETLYGKDECCMNYMKAYRQKVL